MSLWGSIKRKAKKAWHAAKKAVKKVVEDVKDDVEDAVNDVVDTVTDVIDHVTGCSGLLSCTFTLATGLIAGTIAVFGTVVDFVCDLIGDFLHAGLTLAGLLVGGLLALAGVIIPGSFGEALNDFGVAIIDVAESLGEKISDRFDAVGTAFEFVTDWIAAVILAAARWLLCSMRGSRGHDEEQDRIERRAGNKNLRKINHFFVLMLENRSFDHFLGHWNEGTQSKRPINTGIDGVPPAGFSNTIATGDVYTTGIGAADALVVDPPHEFDDVQAQIG